jgi:iron complex transport system ATP-binding protein
VAARRIQQKGALVSDTLAVTDLSAGYGERRVIDDLTIEIPQGEFTVIIGPNGCGKSTLLRSLARLIKPFEGSVVLGGKDIATIPSRELARRVGLLPQSSIAPEGITVIDLVTRGRHPHQGAFRTRLEDLSTRVVDELSGGQRQRVWIAMALAQQTPLLLLDEPTTYLDISHQIDVLDLCTSLQREGRTLVAVLHDLNQAARYATHVIALADGRLVAQGRPADVVTSDLLREVFDVGARVIEDPETGGPLIVPHPPAVA